MRGAGSCEDKGRGVRSVLPLLPSPSFPTPFTASLLPPLPSQELANVGVLQRTASALGSFCVSLRDVHDTYSLRWHAQSLWGCRSSDTTCCQDLPDTSFLHQLGLTALQPQTPASCAELPGCVSDSYCFPAWHSTDACKDLTNSSACSARIQCQVGRTGGLSRG